MCLDLHIQINIALQDTCCKLLTTSGIAAREDVLTPDAPCGDTSNDGSEGEEGSLAGIST
jgi:hypothetical protein